MSAIAGFLGLDGRPAEATKLERMINVLSHRGPDGAAIRCGGVIGLGHRMLWTTPQSMSEELPLAKGNLLITADARIDNREELISALGLEDHLAATLTDSALILAAYEKWGENCPEKLLGDFAFGIWDQRNQVLFCARDYFGVRPFYYYHRPGRVFAFASEIKALLCLPDVPCRLNEARIGDYLAVLPGDKTSTFYQDVLRLPPAHSLTVHRQGIGLREFWAMDPVFERHLGLDREYAETYLDVFAKAVHCRLRSAFPIGSALSGGLDSSSVVCVAREYLERQREQPLKTFSGIFETVLDSDERPYIDALIAQGGIEPHHVQVDRISPLVELERVLWHQEEPIWAPNLFMHWGLYGAAQQQGVRIFLDGFLGDNVVCHGWEYLMDLAHAWRWISLFGQIKGIAKRQRGYSLGPMLWRYCWEYSFKPRLPRLLRRARSGSGHAESAILRLDPAINPDFARRIDLLERYRVLQPPPPKPPGAARQRQYRDLTAGEIPLGLEVANKTASAFSLEGSYPFADRRVAELCLATPSDQRVHDGRSRLFVRRALANHLPEKICWRSDKGDLSHNLKQGLLRFERERLDEVILHNPLTLETYFDMAKLRRSYLRYKEHPTDGDFRTIWSAVNLAFWLRQMSDRWSAGEQSDIFSDDHSTMTMN